MKTLTAVILFLLCIGGVARADTLFFTNPQLPRGTFSGPYTEDRFTVTVLSGNFTYFVGPIEYECCSFQPYPAGMVFGQLDTDGLPPAVIEIQAVDGSPFTFSNVLFAHNGYYVGSQDITGFSGTNAVYTDSPFISDHHGFYEEYSNPYNAVSITSLEISFVQTCTFGCSPLSFGAESLTALSVSPVSATPEPSSLALLGSGVVVACAYASMRRRQPFASTLGRM